MRNFFFLLALFSFSCIAQEGINYQGVATNTSGAELINQNISIQTSIISDSATGNVQWQETHSTTTDQFGLFNLVIGQGASTGSGLSSSFDNIQWGSGNHYLKIEMDATGGSNFSLISTSQMMSVPYALYAKSAGIDSTMLANMIGASVGGCDLKYPEGLDGEGVIWNFNSGPYIVPSGKTLYINNYYSNSSSSYLNIDGIQVREGKTNIPYVSSNFTYYNNNYLTSPIIASSGQIISVASLTNLSTFSGMLVDENNIQGITYCLSSTSSCGSVPGGVFTVPLGKKLYILSYYAQGSMGNLNIDNIIIKEGTTNSDNANSFNLPVIVNSGQSVSSTNAGPNSFNGYLVDENYFADCGGGSSSSAGLDSAMVAGMIANALSNNTVSTIPIGTIQAYSGTTSPNGWLLCDGSAISRSTYSDLFSVIDTTYGIGDGSYTLQWIDSNNDGIMQPGEMINVMSTFNLPDLRGRTIIGTDNMGGTSANVVNGASYLGIIGGAETHTLTVAEMPNHNHSFYAVGSQGTGNHNDGGTSNSIGTTFITTSSEGGDQPHNNMQPYITLNYIIKY